MNTLVAAVSSVVSRIYVSLYAHIMIYYTHAVYIYLYLYYVRFSVQRASVSTKSKLLIHKTLYNIAQNILQVQTFFEKWAVCNHGGPTEAKSGCGNVSQVFFLSGWLVCLSSILQIRRGYIQICSACTEPTFHPSTPTTGCGPADIRLFQRFTA